MPMVANVMLTTAQCRAYLRPTFVAKGERINYLGRETSMVLCQREIEQCIIRSVARVLLNVASELFGVQSAPNRR